MRHWAFCRRLALEPLRATLERDVHDARHSADGGIVEALEVGTTDAPGKIRVGRRPRPPRCV